MHHPADDCGTLRKRAVFDESRNRPASSVGRLVMEATYVL
jgi:hypothetical protein